MRRLHYSGRRRNKLDHGLSELIPFSGSIMVAMMLILSIIATSLGFLSLPAANAEGVSVDLGLTDATDPHLVSIGDNVYVVWQDTGIDGNSDIFIAESVDGAETFDASSVTNISNDAANSTNVDVAVSDGGVVVVVWESQDNDSSDIFLALSDDFTSPIELSTSGTAKNPSMFLSETGDLYFAWEDTSEGNGDIFFASDTNGLTPVNISGNLGNSTNPVIALSPDGFSYIAWVDRSTDDGNSDIFLASAADYDFTFDTSNISEDSDESLSPDITVFGSPPVIHLVWQDDGDTVVAQSDDGGSSFSTPLAISNSDSSANPIVMAAEATDVLYVAWEDNLDGDTDIFLSFSRDAGESFSQALDISENSGESVKPTIALSSEHQPHIGWEEFTPPAGSDIFISANIDVLIESINIGAISDDHPRWNLDLVIIAGSVEDSVAGDTVTVDWGDGFVTTDIGIDSSQLWQANHTYGPSAVGEREITAKLVNGAEEKATDLDTIEVKKHLTSLSLNPILSVVEGSNVTVTGSLIDVDASSDSPVGIENQTIIFDGSGAGDLSEGITLMDGSFTSSGLSPEIAPEGWAVQARFFEDSLYLGADSDIETYDTVSSEATIFSVTVSSQIANLTGFGTVIDFDGAVTEDGSIFVSDCSETGVPVSDRFLPLEETCLWISAGVQLEDNFVAVVDMSVNSTEALPEEIDMFHEEQASDVIVDITQERNPEEQKITGNTQSFGRFMLGIPQQSEAPQGSLRYEVLVGNGKAANLRDINDTSNEPVEITLDSPRYRFTDAAIITVDDPNGNIDPSRTDVVPISIVSESSDPNGIVLLLAETGVDTGQFEGRFTFTRGESSGQQLQANANDEIDIYYTSGARFEGIIDGVVEAGLAQVSDFTITDASTPFVQVSGAVNLELIDAKLGSDGKVTVTMSYANSPLYGADPSFLQLWYDGPEGFWTEVTLKDSEGIRIGVDTGAKTVTGEAPDAGVFVIGKVIGGPGGSGGGLVKPGTGVVLDGIAVVTRTTGGGGGSGSSSSDSTSRDLSTTERITGGDNVQVQMDLTDVGMIEMNFEEIISGGELMLTERTASELTDLFDSTDSGNGKLSIEGSRFGTVGPIFDIDTSEIQFQGSVTVTLPYKESDVGSNESNVRLLHYTENGWEDATVAMNSVADTVTGKVDLLSPVAAAVVEDGTFGPIYFDQNPLSKIETQDIRIDKNEETDSNGRNSVTVSCALKNVQRLNQTYSFIAQVINGEGVTIGLSWKDGTVPPGKEIEISLVLDYSRLGDNEIQILVWDGLINSPLPLSTPTFKSMTDS